jgi:hypothetical protein
MQKPVELWINHTRHNEDVILCKKVVIIYMPDGTVILKTVGAKGELPPERKLEPGDLVTVENEAID